MKAIQMTETGGPGVLKLVEVPDPTPGPGQVLIRVQSAAVNFLDVIRRKGDPYPDPTRMPFIPGAEVAGTVEALGEGVEGPAVGTPVFAVVGEYTEGGYAELAVANSYSVIPVPEGVELDSAAGLLIVGLSATVLLTEVAGVTEASTVFIPAAAGGLGSFAVQISKALGATVIAGAGSEGKRQVALGLGADHAIDYRQTDWPARVRELTDGKGADVVLETLGPGHLPQSMAALAPFGKLVVYGAVNGLDAAKIDGPALYPLIYDPAPSQSLIGFNVGTWFVDRPEAVVGAMGKLVGWVADGTVKGLVSTTLPLADASEAHRMLEAGTSTGKIILKP
ncbi:zinc-binding dehydrogenase [Streptomyces sp. NPDC008092]|uniref:quinone oxidoreductase family protein n=1 Tax=Streptomyces sp. NPDC008092 TaxID=3364808 RepID=UPI0036F14C75